MTVNRLDAALGPAATPIAESAATTAKPASAAPAQAPDAAPGGATANLAALADTLGVDPQELLAHLTGDDAGATAPSPAAAAATALRNPDHPAHAWTGDLTQRRGGLLVDITV